MSESRGAASVTLDTIIGKVLDASEVQHPNDVAEAVTDALLDDWQTVDAAIEAHCVSLKRTSS